MKYCQVILRRLICFSNMNGKSNGNDARFVLSKCRVNQFPDNENCT